jgi:hypothetical protein
VPQRRQDGFKSLSPAKKFPISTSNHFSALNGLTQGQDSLPLDSNHDPGPQHQFAPPPPPLQAPPPLSPIPPPNLISPPSQINQLTTSSRPLIKLSGTVAGYPAVFLVDSGATGNFVNAAFVQQHRLSTVPLVVPDIVKLADGSQQAAGSAVPSVAVSLGSYTDHVDLVSLPLDGYDVILGMTWLHQYNPTIDWRRRSVVLVDAQQHRHVLSPSTCALPESTANSVVKPAAAAPAPAEVQRRPASPSRLNLVTSKQLMQHIRRNQVEKVVVV